MLVCIATTGATAHAAEATVRSLIKCAPHSQIFVLDVDNCYHLQDGEFVSSTVPDGFPIRRYRLLANDDEMIAGLTGIWASHILQSHHNTEPVLAVAPGIIFVSDPSATFNSQSKSVLLRRSERPFARDLNEALTNSELYSLGTNASHDLSAFNELLSDPALAISAAETFLTTVPHHIISDDAILVSSFNSDFDTQIIRLNGSLQRKSKPVIAIDLTHYSPFKPWVLDVRSESRELAAKWGPLLSKNPDLVSALAENLQHWHRDIHDTGSGLAIQAIPLWAGDRAVQTEVLRFEQDASLPSADSFGEYLLELVPTGNPQAIPRYLLWVWQNRPDLRQAFPLIPGTDNNKLRTWALEHGIRESGYSPELMELCAQQIAAIEDASARHLPHHSTAKGVNLIGYISSGIGLGAAARLTGDAIRAAGYQISSFPITNLAGDHAAIDYVSSNSNKYDISVLVINENETKLATDIRADVIRDTYRIGIWAWEVEEFVVSKDNGFTLLDEIWVASDFIKKALDPISPIPVRKLLPPLPQRPAGPLPELPSGLGLTDNDKYFLFVFSYLSSAERKNPWGLIDAYRRAFSPTEDVKLVIKTSNARRALADSERLRLMAAGDPNIIIIDDTLSEADLMGLMAHCLAYVSLHRSEGTGLTIAEAMAFGRPVIVSDYSGNKEFTKDTNAYLIPCRESQVPEGIEPYPAGAIWGEPDIEVAAAAMRSVFDDPETATRIGAQGAQDIATLHTAAAAAPEFRKALDAAWDRAAGIHKRRIPHPKKRHQLESPTTADTPSDESSQNGEFAADLHKVGIDNNGSSLIPLHSTSSPLSASTLTSQILDVQNDYILLTATGTILPENFSSKLTDAISEFDSAWPNWGLAGCDGLVPFGIGPGASETLHFSAELIPGGYHGPNFSGYILPAYMLAGTCLLINAKALRHTNFIFPDSQNSLRLDLELGAAVVQAGKALLVAPQLACLAPSGIRDLSQSFFDSSKLSTSKILSLRNAANGRPARKVAIVTRTLFMRNQLLERNIDTITSFISHAGFATNFEHHLITSNLNAPIENYLGVGTHIADCGTANDTRYLLVKAASRQIEADFIWFIDDDDWLFPGYEELLGLVLNVVPTNTLAFVASNVYSDPARYKHGMSVANFTSVPLFTYPASNHYQSLTFDNRNSFCGVIYPSYSLKKIGDEAYSSQRLFEDLYTSLFTRLTQGIVEVTVDGVLVGQSYESPGNTVSLGDRTRWDQDMSNLVSRIGAETSYEKLALSQYVAEQRQTLGAQISTLQHELMMERNVHAYEKAQTFEAAQAIVRASRTWKLGRAAVAPFRLALSGYRNILRNRNANTGRS